LRFVVLSWQTEINATVFVGFHSRWHVELRDGNFLCALFGEDPKCFTDDRVVLNFFGMLILKDEERFTMDVGARLRLRRGVLCLTILSLPLFLKAGYFVV